MRSTSIARLALTAGAFFAMTGLAFAAPEVTTVEAEELGEVLADSEGMVLYTFQNDEEGVTNCYDSCAENWPPFLAEEGAEEGDGYTLVERDDGTMMWAKDGWPLYYWVNDTEPGMASGDGVGDVWDVARP